METFKDSEFYLLDLPNRFRVIRDFCKKNNVKFEIREAIHLGYIKTTDYAFVFTYYNPYRSCIGFETRCGVIDMFAEPISLNSKALEEMERLECTMIDKVKKHFKIDYYDTKENWEKIKIVYVLSYLIRSVDFETLCDISEMFNYVPSLIIDYIHKELFKKDIKNES